MCIHWEFAREIPPVPDFFPQTNSLLLYGWPTLAAVMVVLWWRQTHTLNAGWVDVAWALGLGGLGVSFALAGEGWAPRRWLVGACLGVWSLRLGWHLWRRVGSESEDGRYANLRRSWGPKADARFFWFFQIQALLAFLLALPVWVLAGAQLDHWRIQDACALAIWFLSLAGESRADLQLKRWRRSPAGRGLTCRQGLWKYSRHPNYFFEWLHWLVYPMVGIGLPEGVWLWLAPLGMLLLIVKVTGIPPTEEQSLRSRGDDYREYQETTNAFFPGPPRDRSQPLVPTK